MKRLGVLVCFLLAFLPICFAQTKTLKGEWKTKQYHKDTLLFVYGGYAYSDSSPDRTEEYTDTTYYWDFQGHDSLFIQYAVRSLETIPSDSLVPQQKALLVGDPEYYPTKKLPGGKKEAREIEQILGRSPELKPDKEKRKKHKDEPAVTADSTIHAMQIRLSLWSAERGQWFMTQDTITVTQTKSFNGSYRLVFISPGKMMLIRIE